MNGYIQLQIGGKSRGFKFGLWVIGQLIDELKISVDQFDAEMQRNPIKTLALLMYYSAYYNTLKAKQEADFTMVDVYDWIDEVGMGSDVIQQFQAAFVDSMSKDVPATTAKKKK